MGRNADSKSKKQQKQESEEQESVQQSEEIQFGEDDVQLGDELPEGEQMIDDCILLKKIQDRIQDQQCDPSEKLAWCAIYTIKQQQAQLNDELHAEIQKIKEKYQQKRLPLMNKIAEVVGGKKQPESFWKEASTLLNENKVDIKKTQVKKIEDYWGRVFESCGLVGNQEDIDLLENLKMFKCELIDAEKQHLKIFLEFGDNEYFVQHTIEIEVQGKVADGNFCKNIKATLKKGKIIEENSLFGLLTSKESDDQQLQETCFDLYRAYISSVYFYFFEPQEGQEFGDEEGEGDENEQDEDAQEDDEEDVKPVKKSKGSAIAEKPECKQQ